MWGPSCSPHYFSSAASWTTSIDNFSVYGTSVAPASIEYTVDCVNLNAVDGIKLVPVEGALSATAKLSPPFILLLLTRQ